jgi:bisphosphoglycerate-dependent phosphoglycerate mutase
MTIKLVLIRHGESIWNKEDRFTGWTDVDLSDKGITEVKEAGRTLREKGSFFTRGLLFNFKLRFVRFCYVDKTPIQGYTQVPTCRIEYWLCWVRRAREMRRGTVTT